MSFVFLKLSTYKEWFIVVFNSSVRNVSIQMSLSYQGTFGSCSFIPEIVYENEARQYQRWTTSGNHVTLLDHDHSCLEAELHKNFHLRFPAILHLPLRSHEWIPTLRRYKPCILEYHREGGNFNEFEKERNLFHSRGVPGSTL